MFVILITEFELDAAHSVDFFDSDFRAVLRSVAVNSRRTCERSDTAQFDCSAVRTLRGTIAARTGAGTAGTAAGHRCNHENCEKYCK